MAFPGSQPAELSTTSRPLSPGFDFSFSWAQASDSHEALEPSVNDIPISSGSIRSPRAQVGLLGPFTTITYEESVEGGRLQRPLTDTHGHRRAKQAGLMKAAELTHAHLRRTPHTPRSLQESSFSGAVGFEQRTLHVTVTQKCTEPDARLCAMPGGASTSA